MKCLHFAVIFGCFINVAITWSLSLTDETTYTEKICYDNFKSRIKNLMTETKNHTINYCINGDAFKFQIMEKARQIQGLTAKCALESDPNKYFKCMKQISTKSEHVLNEIVSIADKFSKINKTACVIDIMEADKYKRSSALYDLNLCLQTNQSNVSTNISKLSSAEDLSPEDIEFYSNALREIKMQYKNLKTCILEDFEYEQCWEEVGGLVTYGHSFKNLTAIDRTENSCIRQFMILTSNDRFQFDLEECLRYGYVAVMESKENEVNDIELVHKLRNFYKNFADCRVINKDFNILDCVHNLLENNHALEIKKAVIKKSEKNFQKFTKIVKDLYVEHMPCIEEMFRHFQFDALNMLYNESFVMDYCLMKGYKFNDSLKNDKDVILTNLQTVQDNIKNCTLHSDSPGLQRCLWNYRTVYGDLFKIIQNDYLKVVVESDRTENTCFGMIVDNGTCDVEEDLECEELRKCVF